MHACGALCMHRRSRVACGVLQVPPGHAPCCKAFRHVRSCCKTSGHALGWCCKSLRGRARCCKTPRGHAPGTIGPHVGVHCAVRPHVGVHMALCAAPVHFSVELLRACTIVALSTPSYISLCVASHMHQRCLGHAFLSAVHFSLVRCLVHARMRCLVHAPAQLSRLRRTLGCASCKSLPGHAPCCQASGHARSCCKTFGHALGWCCKSQVGMRLGSARPHSLLRASGVWLSRYGGRCLSGTSGPPV